MKRPDELADYFRQIDQQNQAGHIQSREQHATQMFDGTRPATLYIPPGEDASAYANPLESERDARQRMRRIEAMPAHMAAMLQRVDPGPSDSVMHVTWDVFTCMRNDPEFSSLATYMNGLLYRTDGSLRERPLRPILANEMGMYRGRIVCLSNNPGDGARTGTLVGASPNPQPAPTVEPDPFPPSKIGLVKGGR